MYINTNISITINFNKEFIHDNKAADPIYGLSSNTSVNNYLNTSLVTVTFISFSSRPRIGI